MQVCKTTYVQPPHAVFWLNWAMVINSSSQAIFVSYCIVSYLFAYLPICLPSCARTFLSPPPSSFLLIFQLFKKLLKASASYIRIHCNCPVLPLDNISPLEKLLDFNVPLIKFYKAAEIVLRINY